MAAMTFTVVPELQPSRWKIVAVASTAVMASDVSQPIDVTHETIPGTLLPCTPKAAREATIVGAEPRFPAMATMPHSRNETMTPTTAATTAWRNDTPNPRMNAP